MAAPAKKSREAALPWLWPALILIVGVALLLDNFLLLGDFNAVALLPLLLVVAGAQILIRGDLLPSESARTFGVTRGSVESATLEVSAGGVDVDVRALQREGRLIAGQYAAGARPDLHVQDVYTHIKMDRAATPWYAMADWQVGLAKDLPWQLLVSTHIGQVTLNCAELVLYEAVVATGFGDVRLIMPYESLNPLHLRSTLGNIHIVTPESYYVRIHVNGSRFFRVRHDEHRYVEIESNVYETTEPEPDAPLVELYLSGTFGDAYLV